VGGKTYWKIRDDPLLEEIKEMKEGVKTQEELVAT